MLSILQEKTTSQEREEMRWSRLECNCKHETLEGVDYVIFTKVGYTWQSFAENNADRSMCRRRDGLGSNPSNISNHSIRAVQVDICKEYKYGCGVEMLQSV